MQKIIKGLLYDIEASELLYTDSVNQRRLYRTQKGNFFLMFPNGNIEPVDVEYAKNKLGEVNAEAYIDIFGKPEEA